MPRPRVTGIQQSVDRTGAEQLNELSAARLARPFGTLMS